jgi:ribosomal protein S18 acetylase RimI-like enzyme
MEIRDGKDYIPQVRELIGEYTRRLGRDLRFQRLDEELDDPAAKYTPPAGELLVLWEDGALLGMVAYHRHSAERCEMKRLYVRPQARGRGLGEALAARILERAKAAGYREMVLDTLAPMQAAISLYEKLGFRACEAYYRNPFEDVIYMRKTL